MPDPSFVCDRKQDTQDRAEAFELVALSARLSAQGNGQEIVPLDREDSPGERPGATKEEQNEYAMGR